MIDKRIVTPQTLYTTFLCFFLLVGWPELLVKRNKQKNEKIKKRQAAEPKCIRLMVWFPLSSKTLHSERAEKLEQGKKATPNAKRLAPLPAQRSFGP